MNGRDNATWQNWMFGDTVGKKCFSYLMLKRFFLLNPLFCFQLSNCRASNFKWVRPPLLFVPAASWYYWLKTKMNNMSLLRPSVQQWSPSLHQQKETVCNPHPYGEHSSWHFITFIQQMITYPPVSWELPEIMEIIFVEKIYLSRTFAFLARDLLY